MPFFERLAYLVIRDQIQAIRNPRNKSYDTWAKHHAPEIQKETGKAKAFLKDFRKWIQSKSVYDFSNVYYTPDHISMLHAAAQQYENTSIKAMSGKLYEKRSPTLIYEAAHVSPSSYQRLSTLFYWDMQQSSPLSLHVSRSSTRLIDDDIPLFSDFLFLEKIPTSTEEAQRYTKRDNEPGSTIIFSKIDGKINLQKENSRGEIRTIQHKHAGTYTEGEDSQKMYHIYASLPYTQNTAIHMYT